ncbi:MAG: hypothetical protein H6R10_604 [Rhodocyclaceae bacterium]|nr:hypothetical protein [Rhodocyclaceae bacterium]
MDNWLGKITAWFAQLFHDAFTAAVDWLHDGALWVFDGLLSAVAAAVAAIPVPSFLSSGVVVANYFTGFPPFALYLLSQLNVSACFAVLGAGLAFRLGRKVLTLFQW